MTNDLGSIQVDQFFPHAAAKVWRALTTPDLTAQWLMPNDFEPVIGHRLSFRANPVAQTSFSGTIACQVLEITPPKRLKISWADAADEDNEATEVCWTLHPEGKGTRLSSNTPASTPTPPPSNSHARS